MLYKHESKSEMKWHVEVLQLTHCET